MAVQNIHLDTLKCSKFSGTDIIKTFCCAEIFSMEKHSGSKQIFFSLLIHHLNFIWKLYHHFLHLMVLKLNWKTRNFEWNKFNKSSFQFHLKSCLEMDRLWQFNSLFDSSNKKSNLIGFFVFTFKFIFCYFSYLSIICN